MGKFYLGVWVNAIQLVIYTLGLFLFVSPEYFDLGAAGLALNLLIVNSTKNILFITLSIKYGEIILHMNNLTKHILIILPSVTLYFLFMYFDLDKGLWWIIFGPSALIIIYLILLLFRQINMGDINLFSDVFNVRKTGSYIKDELKNSEKK
jgi:hypothetical protein